MFIEHMNFPVYLGEAPRHAVQTFRKQKLQVFPDNMGFVVISGNKREHKGSNPFIYF